MAKYGDVEIEFEHGQTGIRIKKAIDRRDNGDQDVTNRFKTAARFEAYDKDGAPLNLPAGTVIVTKQNPTCYWVCCADGWHVYCWG